MCFIVKYTNFVYKKAKTGHFQAPSNIFVMKKIVVTLLLTLLFFPCFAGQKKALKFDKNGDFKIVMLTDLHLVADKPSEAEKTLARIDYIINEEHPDFVAITGDVLYGKDSSLVYLQRLVSKLDSLKTPFAIEFGNHDREHGRSAQQMSKIITSAKYNYNSLTPDGVLADSRINVKPTKDKNNAPLDIYMIDSHGYTSLGTGKEWSYAYLTRDQINWYLDECRKSNAEADKEHVPSLSFFHIPFPEFYDAWILAQEKKHNGVIGLRGEYGGHPKVNSGMYTAMLESGNMMGVFCGHDHDSDYIVDYHGIALVYGRYSGDDTVYNHLAHGTRVISVKEGQMEFSTWIHEDDGRIQYSTLWKNGVLEKN